MYQFLWRFLEVSWKDTYEVSMRGRLLGRTRCADSAARGVDRAKPDARCSMPFAADTVQD